MKKLTLKLSDGRNIEEVIELKNENIEHVFLSLKDLLIRHMMDDNIDRRIELNKEEPEIINNKGCKNADTVENVEDENKTNEKIEWNIPEETIINVPLTPSNIVCENPVQGILAPKDIKIHNDKFKKGTEFFLIAKCPKCGKQKFFKTEPFKTFHCDCGYETEMDEVVNIVGKCPNCDNNIGSKQYGSFVGTLYGMDVNGVVRCNKCKCHPDLEYLEKLREWRIL